MNYDIRLIFFIYLCNSDLYISKLTGHANEITSLAILPNGNFASGSSDKTIIIWNTTDGSIIRKLTGHTDNVRSLAVLPNGDLASGSDDQTIIIWNTNDGSIKRKLTGHIL